MKNDILHILLTLACILWTSCGADKYLKKADQFYAVGEYFDAATQYRKAYMHTPVKERSKRAERSLKAAECYRRINYTARAIGSYTNAIRYGTNDSTAYFYLAQMQHKMVHTKQQQTITANF